MQSRLPDVNTAFNTHRKRAILATESENWTEALGALYSINAALPIEYRVIISNEKYQELMKQDLLATCNGCKEDIDYNTIKILTVLTSVFAKFVTRQNQTKVWFCPKCKYENRLSDTKIEQSIAAQPYYLGVISKPPTRTDSLSSHITYDKIMERWCWTMLSELEERMAQYRDDNWERGDDDESAENTSIDTRLEEADAS